MKEGTLKEKFVKLNKIIKFMRFRIIIVNCIYFDDN
jgi:hypothetical protein